MLEGPEQEPLTWAVMGTDVEDFHRKQHKTVSRDKMALGGPRFQEGGKVCAKVQDKGSMGLEKLKERYKEKGKACALFPGS